MCELLSLAFAFVSPVRLASIGVASSVASTCQRFAISDPRPETASTVGAAEALKGRRLNKKCFICSYLG